jgi:hypothetical protein
MGEVPTMIDKAAVEALARAEHFYCVEVEGTFALGNEWTAHLKQAQTTAQRLEGYRLTNGPTAEQARRDEREWVLDAAESAIQQSIDALEREYGAQMTEASRGARAHCIRLLRALRDQPEQAGK